MVSVTLGAPMDVNPSTACVAMPFTISTVMGDSVVARTGSSAAKVTAAARKVIAARDGRGVVTGVSPTMGHVMPQTNHMEGSVVRVTKSAPKGTVVPRTVTVERDSRGAARDVRPTMVSVGSLPSRNRRTQPRVRTEDSLQLFSKPNVNQHVNSRRLVIGNRLQNRNRCHVQDRHLQVSPSSHQPSIVGT